VKSLFPSDTFTGFGPSRVHPAGYSPTLTQIDGRKAKVLREGVRGEAPRVPGVYGMLDRRGQLVYVGKAKLLRARLLSYFRVNSRDPKAGRIIERTERIIWEPAPDEFGALIRELELIRRFRPIFNVQGQPGRQRHIYLCLGRAPAPYAFVSREPTGKETAVFGPLVGAARAGDAARRLNDAFRLRDCSQRQKMHFADQRDLFSLELTPGCLRFDIGACLGPCARLCTQAGYGASARAAHDFLDGADRRLLTDLEAEMTAAAQSFQYERAMALRDKLADLRWLTDRLVWLKNARQEHSYVYPLEGHDGRAVWYLVERGQVRGAVYPPRGQRSRSAVARLLDEVYARGGTATGTVMPKGQVDSVLLVAAWFRKRPEERERCLKWDAA
jgi:excinuclease ABC subunit C